MAKLQTRDYKREEQILYMWSKGYTYKEIGEKLNITRVRVGQIYRRAMREKEARDSMSKRMGIGA